MDSETLLDNIRRASQVGFHSGATSIVDILLRARWCEEIDLFEAFNAIREEGLDLVAVLFQLPFVVRLPEKWTRLSTAHGPAYIHFRTIGTDLNTLAPGELFQCKDRTSHNESEIFVNATLPNDYYGLLTRTQVIISFQLWGRRLTQYPSYLEMLGDPKAFRTKKIYPAKGVLSSNPLTGETYEVGLAEWLHLQTIKVLAEFIPLYAVACMDPSARTMKHVDNYFIMVKTGRVVGKAPKPSVIAQTAKPHMFRNYANNLTALNKRIKTGRSPSVYELYLLEAARQIELGASNLAVVQTVMVLDLFANEIVNDRLLRKLKRSLGSATGDIGLGIDRLWETEDGRIRPSTPEKFAQFFPTIGLSLPADLKGGLKHAIKLRNRIVHRIQGDFIEVEEARKVVHTGMGIIRYCMDTVLARNQSAV